MLREVVARAPTRIDLGGGWTDVPPYPDREGGFVCNVAITRYAQARVFAVNESPPLEHEHEPLIRAALKRWKATNVGVALQNDFPVGAGLGGSSAASAAIIGALAELRGVPVERASVAEEGRRIEVEDLGVAGGRQDHYAATHGGALALTFGNGVTVERLPLSDTFRKEFVKRSTLIYSGQSRISGDTITAVLGAYESGDRRVVGALRRMRELALAMASALRASDIDELGGLMAEHWEHQRGLHPSIPTARIDDIVARARQEGALGAKAMGASGGGCVLIISRELDSAGVRNAVRSYGEILDFDIDQAGLAIVGRAP